MGTDALVPLLHNRFVMLQHDEGIFSIPKEEKKVLVFLLRIKMGNKMMSSGYFVRSVIMSGSFIKRPIYFIAMDTVI